MSAPCAENAAATEIALKPGEIEALDALFPPEAMAAARCTHEGMNGLNA
jgi:hypothetical protein